MTTRPRGRLAVLPLAGNGPSVALVAAALLALVLASSPAAGFYRDLVAFPGWTAMGGRSVSLLSVVDDGLMTGFFFLVTRDVKREAMCAAGRRGAAVLLPAVSALIGMLVPALLYLCVTAGSGERHGWGVPMATDVTFAATALALSRPRSPRLRAFLLTLAVADDVGSIVVIAIAYARTLHWLWLLASAGVIVVAFVATRRRTDRRWIRLACGVALWFTLWRAGVNPTMSGVVLGLLATEAVGLRSSARGRVPSLEQVVGWGVLPVFGFVNAGVQLTGGLEHAAWFSPVFWGIVLAFVVGKPAGILVPVLISRGRPYWRDVSKPEWYGVAQLGGVGFTVALFVNELAFGSSYVGQLGRVGILVGSVLSAALGMVVLRAGRRPLGEGLDGPAAPIPASSGGVAAPADQAGGQGARR